MATLYNHNEMYTLDFSGKKVRENGKPLDKFGLAYLCESINVWGHYTIVIDTYKYDELKTKAIELLQKKEYTNVIIIL